MFETYNIIVPVIDEEICDRFVDSLGFTSERDYRNVILVDNSQQNFVEKYKHLGIRTLTPPGNIGVGRAWNLAMYEVRRNKLYYEKTHIFFLTSSAILFRKSASTFIEKAKTYANGFGLLTEQAWHLIGFTPKTIDQVGEFDTNFYPAYLEDADYLYRLGLANIHSNVKEIHLPKCDSETLSQGDALAIKKNKAQVNFEGLTEYYIRKWGGVPGHEKFLLPYNDSRYSIRDFVPKSITQLKEIYGYVV